MVSTAKISNEPKYKSIKKIQQQIEEKFYPQLVVLTNAGEKWQKSIEDLTMTTKGYLSALVDFSKSVPENCKDAGVAAKEVNEIAKNTDLVLKEFIESTESIKKFISKLQVQSKKEKGHISTMKESFEQLVKKKSSMLKKKKITENEVQEFLNISLEEHENIARIRYEFVSRFNKEIMKQQIEFYKNALQLVDPTYLNSRHNTMSKNDYDKMKEQLLSENEKLEKDLIAAADEITKIVREDPKNKLVNIPEINSFESESLISQQTFITSELQHEELPSVPFVKEHSLSLNNHSIIENIENHDSVLNVEEHVTQKQQLIEELENKQNIVIEKNVNPVVLPRVSKIKEDFEEKSNNGENSLKFKKNIPINVQKEIINKHISNSYPELRHHQEKIILPDPDYEDTINVFKYNTWEYGNILISKTFYSARSRAELGLEKGKKYFFMKGGNRGWIFCRDLDTSKSGWCPSDFVELYRR
uniref:SH3 domain-containing protein n=1 Tax=Parastrongyloides trichosuri TaxID=131310 RepID=A0A0N4ZBA2_PARTI